MKANSVFESLIVDDLFLKDKLNHEVVRMGESKSHRLVDLNQTDVDHSEKGLILLAHTISQHILSKNNLFHKLSIKKYQKTKTRLLNFMKLDDERKF